MNDTPETDKCVKDNKHIRFLQQDGWVGTDKFTYENPVVDLCRRLERERDEARDTVEQLTKHGLDLMDANRTLKRELKRLKGNTK
jgi:hypothetical protein